jgi:hypothetical protein
MDRLVFAGRSADLVHTKLTIGLPSCAGLERQGEIEGSFPAPYGATWRHRGRSTVRLGTVMRSIGGLESIECGS